VAFGRDAADNRGGADQGEGNVNATRGTWFRRAAVLGSIAAVLLFAGAGPLSAATNPYAKKIVFARAGDLYTCDSNGTHVKRLTTGLPVSDMSPRWSADHRSVYFIRLDRDVTTVRRISAGGGSTTVIDIPDPQLGSGTAGRRFTSLGPSRDGRYLFVGDSVKTGQFTTVARIIRYDIAAKTSEFLVADDPLDWEHDYGQIDPSADATSLAVCRWEGDTSALYRFDIGPSTWTTLSASGVSARFGPEDELLMSNWPSRKSTALRRMKKSGTVVKQLKYKGGLKPADPMPYEAFGYSPAGTTVLFGRNGSLYTMPTTGGTVKRIARNAWIADW
jgi:hypothetical protein